MLPVEVLSTLLFNTEKGSQLLDQLNAQLRSLVKNDQSLLDDDSNVPSIWEQKWVNDSTVNGYRKGQSVWLNTQSPEDILNARYDQVEQYVLNNSYLSPLYSQIDKTDQQKVNNFLLKAINGTASKNVGQLYFVGEMTSPVQIKVSLKNNNKDLPNVSSSWDDFYKSSTLEENVQIMMSALSTVSISSLDAHIDEYHSGVSGLTMSKLEQLGFFRADPFALSNVQTQSFYDHQYCDQLRGFDCTISSDVSINSGIRIWKSGYVEQWGYAANDGSQLIKVNFKKPYNYQPGSGFYQNGFNYLGTVNVDGHVLGSNRYIVTVTPTLKENTKLPYPEQPNTIHYQKMYACVDVTQINNGGFSIVNSDQSQSLYDGYYWSTCGYTVTTAN